MPLANYQLMDSDPYLEKRKVKRLLKLLQRRREIVAKMQGLHQKSVDEDRSFSDEEETEYQGYRSEIESLDADIKREEELEALSASTQEEETPASRSVEVTEDEEDKRTKDGVWSSLGEQMEAVWRAAQPDAKVDKRLSTRAASGASEGVGTDGGFLVQTDFSNELLKKAVDAAQIAPKCRRVSISPNANGLKMNTFDDDNRSNGNRLGGVQAFWEGEADLMTASRPKFTQMEWKLKKLTGLIYATDELIQDLGAYGQIAEMAFGEEFAYKIDDAILNGTGSGQPLGIFNSASLVEVAKESGQAADTIVGDNIIKMRARQWARSRPNSVFLINQDTEPQLHKLNIEGDGANTDFLIWMPAGGVQGQPHDTLYGRPVIPVEQMKTLGDKGDILMADFSQYLLIDKGGVKSDVSIHVRFLYNESAFRFVLRIDGQPLWPSPLTPANGSNTQSPFVTLAERA